MTVALDAPERHRHAIEPLMESVVQLARRLRIKPGRPCVGQDRRLGRAGRGGETLEAAAKLLRQEELLADRKRFESGKSESVRVDYGGRSPNKKKTSQKQPDIMQ